MDRRAERPTRGTMVGVTEPSERYEYGYRLADGTECWEREADSGASRIVAHERAPIGDVVLHDDDGTDVVETIRAALAGAGVDGEILRRMVATTVRRTEVVATVTSAGDSNVAAPGGDGGHERA
jgi:hypothetical protein